MYLTGIPLEEVKMLRDETANLVWAVEKDVQDYLWGTSFWV